MADNQTERRTAMLQVMVDASIIGHDLGPFEAVTDSDGAEYETRCRRCLQEVRVGEHGLIYSFLTDECWLR